MKQVDLYGRVRHAVLIEGISQREAARLSFRLLPATYRTLTHHVHILEMNGESFRLNHSRQPGKA
jgi:hypothetical protein